MSVDASVCGLLLVAGSIVGLAVYEALVRASRVAGAEPPFASLDGRRAGEGSKSERRTRLLAGRALSSLSDVLERFLPADRADADELRERLRRAGIALAPETWRSLRVVSATLGAVVALAPLAFGASLPPVAQSVLLVAGVGTGWSVPSFALAGKERERRASIEARLPDAMELLGIAIAAGSPIEQCFREVSASMEGPIAEEFSLVDQEVNLLGHAREAALENMAARCRSQGVSAFVAQLTQAITQGTSISEGLVRQARLARDTAQADMLERIRKMPTKLDIVLSLCFLPPTVILVVVPTVVNLLEFLNDSMG